MTHTITLERGRALLHALKYIASPAEREADAARRQLAAKWERRTRMRSRLPVVRRVLEARTVQLPPWARPSGPQGEVR